MSPRVSNHRLRKSRGPQPSSLHLPAWLRLAICPRMPWYGREWGESALPLEILSHGRAYTASAREVLLIAFSWRGCCLRK
ncbi:unnamed protein product [Schistosoma margrebowiei]|uniref:Uncharacterized protein n=1 Tax=Schistosoma margrebowiei TaxID=48269 RepID=A0A183MKK8_9TREM|nr:unnamed protein product [Schistosoma margrebowiei]